MSASAVAFSTRHTMNLHRVEPPAFSFPGGDMLRKNQVVKVTDGGVDISLLIAGVWKPCVPNLLPENLPTSITQDQSITRRTTSPLSLFPRPYSERIPMLLL